MSCVAAAAAAYAVSPPAIEAVMSRPAVNGIGPMHIPAAWLPILARVGFASIKVEHDRCTNVAAGAWVMAYEKWQRGIGAPAPQHPALPVLPKTVTALAENASVTPGCITGAAAYYHLPVPLFTAVLRTEAGHVGQIHRNANGSYDMGPAQINSTWLPTLARIGVTRRMVLNDGCLNVSIGAWILAQAMQGADPDNPRQFWQHVGDYNSHTPAWNARYARMVWAHLTR